MMTRRAEKGGMRKLSQRMRFGFSLGRKRGLFKMEVCSGKALASGMRRRGLQF